MSSGSDRIDYTHRYSPKSVSSDSVVSQDGRPVKGLDIRRTSPMPLSTLQESEVRDLYYKRVRDKCADEIREFAHCATGRTVTIPFVCRTQRLAMEGCMLKHATRAEEDAAREEWFKRVPERQRRKDDDEAWKESQRIKKKEWWAEYNKGKDQKS